MNPIDVDQEIAKLRDRVTELESQAKLVRFIGGVVVISTIGLIVNAIGEAIHL